MAKNKTIERKTKLKKAIRQNRRIPLFVVAKTKRRVASNYKSRNWRRHKLKIKV